MKRLAKPKPKPKANPRRPAKCPKPNHPAWWTRSWKPHRRELPQLEASLTPPGRRSRRPPSLTPRPKSAQEATEEVVPRSRAARGEGYGPGKASPEGSSRGRSLTERTLMRIGVSNRHAILSLPTRLVPEPARGPALSTAHYWANSRRLCRKSGS